MLRKLLVISCCGLGAILAPAALARVDGESGPLANLTNGQVIEVPEVAQPVPRGNDASSTEPMVVVPVRGPTAAGSVSPVAGAKRDGDAGNSRGVQRRAESEGKALGSALVGAKRAATGAGAGAGSGGAQIQRSDGSSWSDHWVVRTLAALLILGGLLWCVRWFMVRVAAGGVGGLAAQLGAGGRSPAGVMEVLGRYPVSRGHTLVLLKLDRRVLLLGQSPAGFTALSELTDAEDVASILMKTADADGKSMTRRFGELLRGMEKDAGLIEEESGGGSGMGNTARIMPVSPRVAMRLAGGNGGAA